MDVKDLNDSFAMQAFKAEMVSDNVHYDLYDDKIMTLYELLQKPQGLVQAKEISENQLKKHHIKEYRGSKVSRQSPYKDEWKVKRNPKSKNSK